MAEYSLSCTDPYLPLTQPTTQSIWLFMFVCILVRTLRLLVYAIIVFDCCAPMHLRTTLVNHASDKCASETRIVEQCDAPITSSLSMSISCVGGNCRVPSRCSLSSIARASRFSSLMAKRRRERISLCGIWVGWYRMLR